MWGISLPVNWSIYNGGRVRNNIKLQEELTEQRLLAYRQSVLQALAEVESSLTAYNKQQQILAALQRATKATIEGVRLVLVQYDTGLTDFDNVTSMQRDLFALQDNVASSEAQLASDIIRLYKAVGGGW